MKKYYTTEAYKFSQRIRLNNIERYHNNKKVQNNKKIRRYKREKAKVAKPFIFAPNDFRLLDNAEACLLFFRQVRSDEAVTQIGNARFIGITLVNVTQIDYATISILTAISDDLKFKGIVLKGDFPSNHECRKFIEESGFLSHMIDLKGNRFPKISQSDLIFFEKGCGRMSKNINKKITEQIQNVAKHLTGQRMHCKPIKTIILEICANSIEWAGTLSRQWLFGVKYEEGKVVFTVTDVGKGILETLHRRFTAKMSDLFFGKSEDEVLIGAFCKKYGSNTQEINRNKGLPSVKYNFESGNIEALKVLTNNVILHFDSENLSRTLDKGSPRFRGTFYQWEMNVNCLKNIIQG